MLMCVRVFGMPVRWIESSDYLEPIHSTWKLEFNKLRSTIEIPVPRYVNSCAPPPLPKSLPPSAACFTALECDSKRADLLCSRLACARLVLFRYYCGSREKKTVSALHTPRRHANAHTANCLNAMATDQVSKYCTVHTHTHTHIIGSDKIGFPHSGKCSNAISCRQLFSRARAKNAPGPTATRANCGQLRQLKFECLPLHWFPCYCCV